MRPQTRSWLAAAALAALPAVAAAQAPPARPERPVRGLFGGEGNTRLLVTLSTFGGWDRSQVSTAALTAPPVDATYGGGTANLAYNRPVGEWPLGLTGMADGRYYPASGTLEDLISDTYYAGATLGHSLGRRGVLRTNQAFSSSSFYQFNPFGNLNAGSPIDLIVPSSDYRLVRGRTYSYDANLGTDWRVGRRSTLALDYRYRHVSYPTELVQMNLHGGGVRYEHQVARRVTLRLGYGYDRGSAASGEPTGFHRIDSGLAVATPLPFSRRTVFTANSGFAVVEGDDSVNRGQQVLLIGNVALSHQFPGTWTLEGGYSRDPQIVEIYRTPVYTDTAYGALRGRVGSRVSLSLWSGYSNYARDAGLGEVGTESFYVTGNAGFRMVRMLYAYCEYAYYDFDSRATIAAVTAEVQTGRHSVRAGLSWTLPLLLPRRQP